MISNDEQQVLVNIKTLIQSVENLIVISTRNPSSSRVLVRSERRAVKELLKSVGLSHLTHEEALDLCIPSLESKG